MPERVTPFSLKISRRNLIAAAIFGVGLVVGRLSAPCPIFAKADRCPPDNAPSSTPGLNYKMGLNIPRDGSFDPEKIVDSGAGWVRFVAMPEEVLDPGKVRGYLARCRNLGLKSLLVVARESLGNRDWQDAARFYAKNYDGAVDAWQIGNEPDDNIGQWSWPMEGTDFTRLMWTFRDAMPGAYLVAGGLDTNRPEYLEDVRLDWVDAIAIHPYGQGLPGWSSPYGFPDHVGVMIERYLIYAKSFDKDLLISEWGINHNHFGNDFAAEYISRMMSYLRDSDKVKAAFYYNLIDKQDPGFSLLNPDGSKKPSYDAFKNVAFSKNSFTNTPNIWSNLGPFASRLSPFP